MAIFTSRELATVEKIESLVELLSYDVNRFKALAKYGNVSEDSLKLLNQYANGIHEKLETATGCIKNFV